MSAVLAFLAAASLEPEIKSSLWRGMDAITMQNRSLEVVIVPKLGRIMSIRKPGGKNVLYAPQEVSQGKGWTNWGGDKIWFAPQTLWVWPPDTDLDGSPHSIEIVGGSVTMSSKVSSRWGYQVSRTLSLSAGGTLMSVNKVTNWSAKPEHLFAWQVTQIGEPKKGWLSLGDNERFHRFEPKKDLSLRGTRMTTLTGLAGNFLEVTPVRSTARKFGTYAPLAAALTSDSQRVHLVNPLAKGGVYPDSNSPIQLFCGSDESGYLELEALGPIKSLSYGESAEFSTYLWLES